MAGILPVTGRRCAWILLQQIDVIDYIPGAVDLSAAKEVAVIPTFDIRERFGFIQRFFRLDVLQQAGDLLL